MRDKLQQIEVLRKQRRLLDEKIVKLERQLFLPSSFVAAKPPPENDPNSIKKWKNSPDFIIEFDGGTSCNVPSRGFGKGYGSFQINNGPIRRVEFGMGHSCNSAEIRTLVSALEAVRESCDSCHNASVLARGDSRIALKWASCKSEPKEKHSENFREAIKLLREQIVHFGQIRTEWRNRSHSVRIFGH